ncbi:hypothetical protein A6V39_01605 [Candidatus Mycoplasma haematobovis]|uniref:YqaJ viral recombinase domain-containing protein n=1 Tax=Candidatus Mycoplasma haematobovis TaxID=432608 RepID=A0A1A9QER2_9MOLU|nr:YqaJ viral recombinase family protein [Candidatus Mycoplasma haematobovis]OAL10738.1 hypothetical protein A6V39_01605 [Candidatus Mycoplasma haematobovis]
MKFDKYVFREDFIFKNNRIHLTPQGLRKLWRPKKLTGSRIGAVFGNDTFRTPFQAWCDILGFFKEDPDLFFINAGRVIEPKLKKYAEEKMGFKFISYDPVKVKYDLFSTNRIFGGIPDGEEFDENGKVISILEIKTAQLDKYKWNFQDNQFKLVYENGEPVVSQKGGGLIKWFKNGEVLIPESYKDQLSLYLYLRGISVGYFCVAFLKHEDYLDPDKVEFSSEFNSQDGKRILLWKKFEIDLEKEAKRVEEAKKWYEEHIIKGISPELSTKDLEWFRYGYPDLSLA